MRGCGCGDTVPATARVRVRAPQACATCACCPPPLPSGSRPESQSLSLQRVCLSRSGLGVPPEGLEAAVGMLATAEGGRQGLPPPPESPWRRTVLRVADASIWVASFPFLKSSTCRYVSRIAVGPSLPRRERRRRSALQGTARTPASRFLHALPPGTRERGCERSRPRALRTRAQASTRGPPGVPAARRRPLGAAPAAPRAAGSARPLLALGRTARHRRSQGSKLHPRSKVLQSWKGQTTKC